MREGGRTPEELETLLEDACIARNVEGVLALFDDDGVLVASGDGRLARGGAQIARAAAAIWCQQPTYVASPERVVQARDIALSLGGGINVIRRGPDGAWRFAIALLHTDVPMNRRNIVSEHAPSAGPRLLAAGTGETTGPEDGVRDRYMIDGADSGGRFAVVQHLMAPRALAAPLHRHTREDEYSFVLEGRVGAVLGEEEVFAEAGDLLFKPRDQWHTFWNASDAPARILEIISPAGLEDLFRQFGAAGLPEPEILAAMAAEYGAELDFEATMPIVERHSLVF